MRLVVCSLCGKESKGNLDRSKEILCPRCIHLFMRSGNEEKVKLYEKLVKKNLDEVAYLISLFIKEKEVNYEVRKKEKN